jgi:hypothetical protein
MLLHVYLFSLSGFYVDSGLVYSVHSIIEHVGVPHRVPDIFHGRPVHACIP